MPILNRRETLLGLSGLTCAAALPGTAAACGNWAMRLTRDLDGIARPGTRLRLHAFAMDDTATQISAVIEMAWQPGLRRRRVAATGETVAAAYEQLLGQVVTTFGTINPQGIRKGSA